MKRLFYLEKHELGPRVFILRFRVHEWHLGIGIILLLILAAALNRIHDSLPTGIAAFAGVYLIYKDWRDIIPSKRDRYAWKVGLHRLPSGRIIPRGDRVPLFAALLTFAIGIINLSSSLTPNVSWRGRVLLSLDPIDAVPVIHSFAIPVSLSLIVSSFYLAKRRERAFKFAFIVSLFLVPLNLAKGLDFEESALSLAVACLLWWARDAFYVRAHPLTLRTALSRIPLVILSGFLISYIAVRLAVPGPTSTSAALKDTYDFLTLSRSDVPLHKGFSWLPLGVFLLGLLALLESAYLLFRPTTAPGALPSREVREAAIQLIRSYGKDTLSFFKLRHDKLYLFSDDERAFIGYRIESGSFLVSGDPVGDEESIPALLQKTLKYASEHGLRVAVVGASEELRNKWQDLGLKSLYMGDEAIIDVPSFSLEGRAIRKIRQSVSRLEKAGYSFEVSDILSVSEKDLEDCERVSSDWREGKPERGFSMSLDVLGGEGQEDSLLAVARDESGIIRGFIHLVPSYGRSAYSLAFMRREKSTPNGLMEFLVVRCIEALKEKQIEEMSLNFAVFARFINDPKSPLEKILGKVAKRASAWMQIESLYRFNAKFFPRWVSRYYLYQGPLRFLATGIATLFAEGQLEKPRLGKRR